jgi:IPTL-CTERM motif
MKITRIAFAMLCCGVFLMTNHAFGQLGLPCTVCPAGANVIVNCNPALPHDDSISDEGGVVGLDADLDSACATDVNMTLVPGDYVNRPSKIRLLNPKPSATTFNTELRQMWLKSADGTVEVKAGLDMNAGANATQQALSNSTGQIVQKASDNTLADSFFDVFVEVKLPSGLYAYNQTAIHVQSAISCIPPRAEYIAPQVCTPLYSQPGAGGTLRARLTAERHLVNENVLPANGGPPYGSGAPIPTVSQWGLVIMTLLLLAAATVIFVRRRPAVKHS